MKKAGLFLAVILIGFFLYHSQPIDENPLKDSEIDTIYVYIEEEDLQELYSRDPYSNDRLEAFTKTSSREEDLKPIEIRFRGDSTRMLPKKSFNIRFQEGQDFLFGSERMNLNATYTDPSMMREKLSMDMFHHIGLPAPRTKYFNLYVNDIYEGLYIHVERIDENLLKNTGVNPEGTLVRDGFTGNLDKEEIDRSSFFGYDIASQEDPIDLLEENFSYRGNPKWQEVIDLGKWVYETPPGDEFYQGFKERFYFEEFLDWIAIHLLIGDIDSYADDYWLYKDHHSPGEKWRIIPWDKDLSFGSTYRPEEYVDNNYFTYEYIIDRDGYRDNEMIASFLTTPVIRQKLYDRLEYFMEEVFTPDYFQQNIQILKDKIEQSVNVPPGNNAFALHPQNHHAALDKYEEHVEVLMDFIELRYQFLRKQIHPPPARERYKAKMDISTYKEGDTVYFTDDRGWTIGKLEIKEILNPGSITLSVSEKENIKGINRIWEIEPGMAEVSGELTLYYRNDVYYFGRANWYEEDKAIGNQWELTIAQYNADDIEVLASRVNPYSNKVSAEITINNAKELIITYQ